jgi:hypothetical protein
MMTDHDTPMPPSEPVKRSWKAPELVAFKLEPGGGIFSHTFEDTKFFSS